MVTERLFGDPLRRDHMNFLYSVIKIIDDSDEYVKNNMRNKDKNSVNKLKNSISVLFRVNTTGN